MYWYDFTEEERERSRRQAEAAAEHSDSIDRVRKEIGNLGETAFWRWCQVYLPDSNHWEWNNRAAWEDSEPETNPFDFEIKGTDVDVKTTGESSGHSAKRWAHYIGTDDETDIYVFARVTASHEEAVIAGWARKKDVYDSARTPTNPFDYFPVRDMHDMIPQLNLVSSEAKRPTD
jgi:hypothetical protein